MKRLAFLIISILIFQFTFAQSNFIEGKMTTNSGEVVSGFINYKNWSHNPNTISFQKEQDGEIIKYGPEEIKGFSLADEVYKSAFVEQEVSKRATYLLNYNAKLNLAEKHVFLKAMVEGEKSLYIHKSSIGFENFYIYQDEKYELLIHKSYLKEIEKKDVIVENKKYIGQLTLYLDQCNDISKTLSNTKYNQYSLERLFETYYKNCSSSDLTYETKTESGFIQWGVLAGVSITSYKFDGVSVKHLHETDFPSSTNISAGAFLELVFQRNFNRWSLNNELIYTSFSTEGKHSTQFVDSEMELAFSFFKLNNMLRYKYPIGDAFLFANMGLSNGLISTNTNYLRQESTFNAVITEKEAIEHVRNLEFGLLGGVGGSWRNFSLEARYELGNGVSNYINVSSYTHRLYFFLGYRF